MRSTGVRRKLDDLGRVVIPAGIRRTLDLRDGDAIEFTVAGDEIILTRATDRCVVCGHQGQDLHEVRGRKLCERCVGEVASLAGRGATPDETAGDETASVVTLTTGEDQDDETGPGGYDQSSTTAW